jgi:hypothetical protein
MRMLLGCILLVAAIICATTGLQTGPGISPEHITGQLVATGLLTLIFGFYGIRMMRRRAPR